jgi:hypothetical protein
MAKNQFRFVKNERDDDDDNRCQMSRAQVGGAESGHVRRVSRALNSPLSRGALAALAFKASQCLSIFHLSMLLLFHSTPSHATADALVNFL